MLRAFSRTLLIAVIGTAVSSVQCRGQIGAGPTDLSALNDEANRQMLWIQQYTEYLQLPITADNKRRPTLDLLQGEGQLVHLFRGQTILDFQWTDRHHHDRVAENDWREQIRDSLWGFYDNGDVYVALCMKPLPPDPLGAELRGQPWGFRGRYTRQGNQLSFHLEESSTIGASTATDRRSGTIQLQDRQAMAEFQWAGSFSMFYNLNNTQGGMVADASMRCRFVMTPVDPAAVPLPDPQHAVPPNGNLNPFDGANPGREPEVQQQQPAITGIWIQETREEQRSILIWSFRQNGTLSVQSPGNSAAQLNGTWNLADGFLHITWQGQRPFTVAVTGVNGDEVSLEAGMTRIQLIRITEPGE